VSEEILNNDTSHGQAARWTKWIGHFAGQPNLRFLEIGSYEGQSALWFLRNLLTHPTSKLLCVDTWHAGEDMPYVDDDTLLTTFLNNIDAYRANCGIMRGRSQDVLLQLPPDTYDFVYIDGSHTTPSVLMDSVLAWRVAKPGGILIWDDYLWELPMEKYPTSVTEEQKKHIELLRPKTGIDAFLTCYEGQYEVIAKEWQVALKKKA
jgi:predicted O-methyltransferase YrrM